MSMPSLDLMKFITNGQDYESRHYSMFVGCLFYARLCYTVTKTSIYLVEEPDTWRYHLVS